MTRRQIRLSERSSVCARRPSRWAWCGCLPIEVESRFQVDRIRNGLEDEAAVAHAGEGSEHGHAHRDAPHAQRLVVRPVEPGDACHPERPIDCENELADNPGYQARERQEAGHEIDELLAERDADGLLRLAPFAG